LTQSARSNRPSVLTTQSQWLNNGVLPRLQSPLSAQLRYASTNANEEPKKEEAKSEEETKSEEKKDESAEDKDGQKKGEEKDSKTPPPPPPPHGDKSPWSVFYETLQQEFQKSQEWQEGTKALASGAKEVAESPAVKKAKEAYSTTAEVTSKVAGKTGEVLKSTAHVVGKGAAWTWDTEVVKAGRTVVRKTAEGVDKATKPVRETKVYKTVATNIKETVDDGSSSRYGGYIDREERRRLRELREAKELKEGKRQTIVEENEEYVGRDRAG
jgi:mitochondrial import inner membrane translocase subunit TIM44